VTLRPDAPSELAQSWLAVLTCFVTAVFGWGFGFTGLSVYLAQLHQLHQLHDWPTALISAAITTYYLLGALCLTQVHVVLRRIGPARLAILVH
jgi:TRAP-type C4-dicarboxylate transport system permease small subunit